MKTWRLKRGLEKKFRFGHPWTFSNELADSPKGAAPGELVELRSDSGEFLAVGYGNPGSLISFRALSRDAERVSIDADFFYRKLRVALATRRACGFTPWSFRLAFAEADGLPGLVVDRFALAGEEEQVLVAQSSTAGMDRLRPFVYAALERLAPEIGARPLATSIIACDDSSSRRLEGLEIEEKRSVYADAGFHSSLSPASVLLQSSALGVKAVAMQADLLGGQKTGFFLDQRANIRLAASLLPNRRGPLRMLDICCYVGQWSAQLTAAAKSAGLAVESTLLDSSAKALELAANNVRAQGADVRIEKRDALGTLSALPPRSFDVVVCDPPAFAKGKKHLPAAQAAYAKINREALKRLAPGGLFVTCSCSGLLTEEDFRAALARAFAANEDLDMRLVARGGHAPDHPQLPQFPQGTYLKCWVAVSAKGEAACSGPTSR